MFIPKLQCICESFAYLGVGYAGNSLIGALLSNHRYLGVLLETTSSTSLHATIRTPERSGSIGGSRTGYWTKVVGMSPDIRFILALRTLSSEGQAFAMEV